MFFPAPAVTSQFWISNITITYYLIHAVCLFQLFLILLYFWHSMVTPTLTILCHRLLGQELSCCSIPFLMFLPHKEASEIDADIRIKWLQTSIDEACIFGCISVTFFFYLAL